MREERNVVTLGPPAIYGIQYGRIEWIAFNFKFFNVYLKKLIFLDKLHGSQSLSTTDGDNLSMCTDTDDMRYVRDKPHVETLLVEVRALFVNIFLCFI